MKARRSRILSRAATLTIVGLFATGAMAGGAFADYHGGNANKKDNRGCGDSYSRIHTWEAQSQDTALLVDLNQDTWVCEGLVADTASGGGTATHYNYKDNMANQ